MVQISRNWQLKKQDAAQPECSPVKHCCETIYLNSLAYVSFVAVPVRCRLWNAEEGGVQSKVWGAKKVKVGVVGCGV